MQVGRCFFRNLIWVKSPQKKEKKTTFAVESHTTYDKEVKEGDEVDINLLFLDRDKKRLIYKLEMTHKEEGYRAATTEVC